MNDFFNEMNEAFDLMGFGKPIHLNFKCKNFDMKPAYWEETETGYKCTCRTVGIDSKDVKIEIIDDCICVSGKTEFDGYTYSTQYDLPILYEIKSDIKKVRYQTKNGITIIYLDLEKPEKKEIKIEKM